MCGSNARCIALLAVFKKIIQNYTTPPEKELRRDLDAVIKPHIKYFTSNSPPPPQRPVSFSLQLSHPVPTSLCEYGECHQALEAKDIPSPSRNARD